MIWHSTATGSFAPEDLSSLKQIFDDITSQPWFAKDQATLESFAKYLLETFPGSAYDPAKHRAVAEASARMFYGIAEGD